MNIKEYISSGIVESYVLGLVSVEERAEFEALCLKFPELVAARNDFEIALEQQILSHAVAPGANVKDRLMSTIRNEGQAEQSRVIAMENGARRSSSSLRWVAAASIILLLASAYFAYSFYNKNKELENELARSQSLIKDADTRLAQLKEAYAMMSDPNVAVVTLKGMEPAPRSSANIYWDSTSTNVYMVAKNMPRLPNDKQYQLWAIIDGKPKDLGLFDMKSDGHVTLKMINAQKAEAFAITIEDRGHSGPPTMDQMQTYGKTDL